MEKNTKEPFQKSTGLDEQSSVEQFRALFDYATIGIVVTDSNGRIINFNKYAEIQFEYLANEILGSPVEILLPQAIHAKHETFRKGFHQHPQNRAMGIGRDLYARKKDDSEFPVEISLSPYKDESGSFVIAFIIDVSERKLHEENIIKLNHNLENKVEERTKVLQEALIELENSKEKLSKSLEKEKGLNEMKSRFVSMASHEFRTPLSTILSSVSLISKYKTSEEDDKREKHVQKIKSSVSNMTLILNDFLSEDRLEEGKVLANKSEFSIKKLCDDIISEMAGLKKMEQQIIYIHVGNELVLSDHQIIKNIIINLLSNAIKFTDEHKTISVKTATAIDEFKIEVTDQGIGIPIEEQANLFTRFFRARNVTNIQGTGLGLSIVSKYIEILDGKIEFTSTVNYGTTFIITLPNI